MTGVYDSAFGPRIPQEYIDLSWLAPAASCSYAEKMNEVSSDVICLLNCQQTDHVCIILMSKVTKL